LAQSNIILAQSSLILAQISLILAQTSLILAQISLILTQSSLILAQTSLILAQISLILCLLWVDFMFKIFTFLVIIYKILIDCRVQGNKSLQTSQLLEETAGHKVETYGLPLPVIITEA